MASERAGLPVADLVGPDRIASLLDGGWRRERRSMYRGDDLVFKERWFHPTMTYTENCVSLGIAWVRHVAAVSSPSTSREVRGPANVVVGPDSPTA